MLTIYIILNIMRKVPFSRRPLLNSWYYCCDPFIKAVNFNFHLNQTVAVRLKRIGIVYSKVGKITEAFSRSDHIV